MRVKCHRTICALMWTKRLKAFHPWGKMLSPCIYLYAGCYGFSSVPTGLSALPAPLHSDALPLVGLDCTGEHVQLVSEHSTLCLGNDTLRKHLHGNAIKSSFLWIVQPVLGDSGRKRSVRGTRCRDGQRVRDWGGEECGTSVLRSSFQHSVLIDQFSCDETHLQPRTPAQSNGRTAPSRVDMPPI